MVVGGDINDDIFKSEIQELLAKHNLSHLVYERHGHVNAPATHSRNTNGTKIDGLWGTPGVQVKRSGQLEPGDFPGDHCTNWADITYESVMGHNPPVPRKPATRKLKLYDSKCVQWYLKLYTRYLVQHDLFHKQYLFESSCLPGKPLTPDEAASANTLDDIRTKCMAKAERKCRKLRMGAVEFSE